MKRARAVGILAIAFLSIAGCGDSDPPTGPTTGSLTITLTTLGEDAPSGYTVVLDGSITRSVDANGTTTFTNLSEGMHEVSLTDIPANCTTGGDDAMGVVIEAGGQTPLAITVMCDALVGSIEINVTTTGADIPDTYRAVVDGGSAQRIDANGTARFTGLPVGTHLVELTEVPANCRVTGQNPASVTVEAGNTSPVTMTVECSRDQLIFTRRELDIFTICMINADGSGLAQLAEGGIATDVSSDGTQLLYVTPPSTFSNAIWRMGVDGSNPVQLTTADGVFLDARWSPDGGKIVYSFRTVGGVDTDFEIWVMNSDGSASVQLTDNDGPSDTSPTWSPDGTKIAFVTTRDGNREIYAMSPDGTNPTRLTHDFADDQNPDWSHDGSMIAFASNRGPDIDEIWVMNADGSNALQLTTGLSVESGVEPYPTWSPDGSRIAFSAELEDNISMNIGVMNSDGSGITKLTDGFTDFMPLWIPQTP
jgi:tricorn protease-like protein